MAGRPKQGIDYAGWSVNIFDGDTKIDKLLDAQGWIGFSIYFYLCQMAYKFDGYFYRWSYDDSATTARRMSGGVSSKTVENTVGLCLQIGLFDKPLFDRHGILTSKGIQRRFLAAIQGRRVKSVISNYWLLKDEESEGPEKCVSNDDLQAANRYLQGADAHLQGANSTKGKESKGKESKGDDIRCGGDPDLAVVFAAYLDKIGDRMTERIRDELVMFTRVMGPECCIRAMDEAIEAGAVNWRYVRGTLTKKREQGVRCIADWNKKEEERRGINKSGNGNAGESDSSGKKRKLEVTKL